MIGFNKFLASEDAIGVVEMVLILAVLVGLIIIFKKQLTTLIKDIFSDVFDEADDLF